MKSSNLFQIFICLCAILLISTIAQAQTLQNASIKFHTTNDDKDNDTHVTVDIMNGNGTVVAHIDNDFGHFNDNSDNGPYDIPISGTLNLSDMPRGSVKIRIDPNGHDTWNFNYFLNMTFSDGTPVNQSNSNISLKNQSEQIFGLNTATSGK